MDKIIREKIEEVLENNKGYVDEMVYGVCDILKECKKWGFYENYNSDLDEDIVGKILGEVKEEPNLSRKLLDQLLEAFLEKDEKLFSNKEFVKKMEKESTIIIPYIKEDIQKEINQDRDFILELAKNDFSALDYITEYDSDKEFILEMLRENGMSNDGNDAAIAYSECRLFNNKQYEELLEDKEFLMEVLNLIPYTNMMCYNVPGYPGNIKEFNLPEKFKNDKEIALKYLKNCGLIYDINPELLEDREFLMNILEIEGMRGFKLPEKFKSDKEVALKYVKNLSDTSYDVFDEINPELLEDREFFMDVLDMGNSDFDLPEKFGNDKEVVIKYLQNIQQISGINWNLLKDKEVLDNLRKVWMEEEWRDIQDLEDLHEIQRELIAAQIEETNTVVTHFGDDLDNKAAIYALQKWAEDNDLIKIGHPLEVVRVPAGQIKEGMLNVDTGGHKGSRLENGTVIIDGDLANNVKSASEALSDLGIYVPEQIVELADTKPNRVSALDSRSGLALVRYLTGEQTFKLAEAELLDKSLTDEQLEEFGLTEAHEKQQAIIDNAVEKIEKYTVDMPNGEKIVLAPEQILAGSSIAYEKGINYYASASEHLDENKNPDGVTFAITCKPGVRLPEEVIAYGNELVEQYRINENSSGVFVSPNGQMIVAGGFKNPEFKIPNESIKGMLEKIEGKFTGKDLEKIKEEK